MYWHLSPAQCKPANHDRSSSPGNTSWVSSDGELIASFIHSRHMKPEAVSCDRHLQGNPPAKATQGPLEKYFSFPYIARAFRISTVCVSVCVQMSLSLTTLRLLSVGNLLCEHTQNTRTYTKMELQINKHFRSISVRTFNHLSDIQDRS